MLELGGNTFVCDTCFKVKPVKREGGTGYATGTHNQTICYDCCAEQDRKYMCEYGRITLYLTHPNSGGAEVTNWPGTLRFKTGPVVTGRHNIARRRYDFRFTGPDGHEWRAPTTASTYTGATTASCT